MMAKKKGVPNVFLWCSRVSPSKKHGGEHVDARNCVIKVEGTKKCTWNGEPAECVETAFMYELPKNNYPKYRRKK